MSAKVDHTAVVEAHRVQNSATASSSTSSANSPKVSMFKGKAGFVIPKNKFSGSLVPIFKGGKKSENNDAGSEENSKQVQRKTKWGPDLSQDTGVRRGRALAYQTRVDQITQQLKLGSLSGDSQSSKLGGDVADSELSTTQVNYEKLHALELERREAIGEILKLNPSYKAPSDYQPVMRETTVSVPVKEHPGYDFVGLVYGPDGDTHKRLEKETGTRIQVYGTKTEREEKVEITASNRSEVISLCDEIHVQISADTYEKVDAAAALIELLLSSVPGKSAASEASASVSGNNAQVLNEGTNPALSTAIANQELVQPVMVPISTSSQRPFQLYPGSWFPTSQPPPSSMAFTFNPSPSHLVFGPRPGAPYGFGSSPQGIRGGPSRLHPPAQVMQGPFVPPPYSLGQTGPPRNHSATGSPSFSAPQLAERPFIPTASSAGWAVPPTGGPQSRASGGLVQPIGASQGSSVSQSVVSSPAPPSAPSITPQAFPSQFGPTSGTSFVPSQIRSSSAMPVQSYAPPTPLNNSSSNAMFRPAQTPVPPPSVSHAPQSGMSRPAGGTLNTPSFTPLKPMGTAAPRPPLSGSGDFTFQPHRPQGPPQSIPGPGMHFAPQRPPPPQLPPAPQAASFRPTMQNTIQQHVRQNFPRPQMGNQMGPPPGQFAPPSPNPHVGPRNLGPGPQMPNPGGPFPPRPGHSGQYQQNYPTPPSGRPGGLFVPNQQHSISPAGRAQQGYDPFSPTPMSAQGSNNAVSRKQDSDPEYEDLMASVGVK